MTPAIGGLNACLDAMPVPHPGIGRIRRRERRLKRIFM
jgi:hypothetical protein